jgi:hypothetical protein
VTHYEYGGKMCVGRVASRGDRGALSCLAVRLAHRRTSTARALLERPGNFCASNFYATYGAGAYMTLNSLALSRTLRLINTPHTAVSMRVLDAHPSAPICLLAVCVGSMMFCLRAFILEQTRYL